MQKTNKQTNKTPKTEKAKKKQKHKKLKLNQLKKIYINKKMSNTDLNCIEIQLTSYI